MTTTEAGRLANNMDEFRTAVRSLHPLQDKIMKKKNNSSSNFSVITCCSMLKAFSLMRYAFIT